VGEMEGGDVVEEESRVSAVTPFADYSSEKNMSSTILSLQKSNGSSSYLPSPVSPMTPATTYKYDNSIELSPTSQEENFSPPAGFNEHVFDEAEESIKYLVLTNTWREFVTAVRDGSLSVSDDASS
jgi:hypothetical protein